MLVARLYWSLAHNVRYQISDDYVTDPLKGLFVFLILLEQGILFSKFVQGFRDIAKVLDKYPNDIGESDKPSNLYSAYWYQLYPNSLQFLGFDLDLSQGDLVVNKYYPFNIKLALILLN